MKKSLFLVAALFGATVAVAQNGATPADISAFTNLMPAYDFNTNGNAVKVSAAGDKWNLGQDWITNNVTSGDLDATNGLIALAGGPFTHDASASWDAINNGIQIVDLGGTCGKVWMLNNENSDLADVIADYVPYFDAEITKSTLSINNLHLFFISDPAIISQHAGKNVVVRIEMNLYRKDKTSTGNMFDAYCRDSKEGFNQDDYDYASSNMLKISDFLDSDGNWDPTRWLAYEWEYTINEDPDVAPLAIKMDMTSGQMKDAALLIRSIKIYDPAELDGDDRSNASNRALADNALRRNKLYNTYTVGFDAPEVRPDDISGFTNLTPNFDFHNATAVPAIVNGMPSGWNLSVHWVKDNVINGDVDATDGLIVLSGGAPVYNFPTCSETLRSDMRLLDFGGTCGQVLAANFGTSTFTEAAKQFGLNFDIPNHKHPSGWYEAYHFILVPDPDVMKNYSGKDLRCRIEMNIFENTMKDANAVYAYGVTDENGTADDYSAASANRIKPSDFARNGVWDPTHWLAYEFEFPVLSAPEDIENWDLAPRIKMETEAMSTSTLLIRQITIYDPEEDLTGAETVSTSNRVDASLREIKRFNVYTVGTPAGIDAAANETEEVYFDVNGNEVTFAGNAEVYSIDGAKVADAVAGEAIVLTRGFYVANVAGKGVKFVIR